MRRRAWVIGGAILLLCLLAGAFLFWIHPLWVSDQDIRFHLWRDGVRSEYADVDGYRVHYFEALPPRNAGAAEPDRPLVLVHGLESRGEDWSGLIPTLAAQGYHVYAPDLLGFGRSAKPDIRYSMRQQERFVADFMQTLGVPRADVAGWSMGGWIAAELTVDHPEMVHRLVLLDAAGIYFPATFGAGLFTPDDRAGLEHLSAMLSPDPKPLPGFVARDAIRKLQRDAWVIDRSVDSMTGGRDLLDFRLGAIRQPVLLVWGTQDRLIPPSVGERMHRIIPGSDLLLIGGCGHLAPQECSRPILRGMVEFLNADPPPRNEVLEVQGRTR